MAFPTYTAAFLRNARPAAWPAPFCGGHVWLNRYPGVLIPFHRVGAQTYRIPARLPTPAIQDPSGTGLPRTINNETRPVRQAHAESVIPSAECAPVRASRFRTQSDLQFGGKCRGGVDDGWDRLRDLQPGNLLCRPVPRDSLRLVRSRDSSELLATLAVSLFSR